MAAIERGLTMSDIRKMRLGEVVDYCYAYNERQENAEKEAENKKRPQKRKATQSDINAFFG